MFKEVEETELSNVERNYKQCELNRVRLHC